MWKLIQKWQAAFSANSKIEGAHREILKLSIDEAKQQAESLLADPEKFERVEARTLVDDEFLVMLPPSVRELFVRYQDIQEAGGDTGLHRDMIRPSIFNHAFNENFLVIGQDYDGSEIVVKPHEDAVYVINGSESKEELYGDRYPSVYHWVLMASYNPLS